MKRLVVVLLAIFFSFTSFTSQASDKQELDIKIRSTLKEFNKSVKGGSSFLRKAEAVLVFPEVIKAGFTFGGEYGKGGLLINNKIVEYYSTASASFGLQFGVQQKSVVIVFLDAKALKKFRSSDGWEAGVDGSVAIAEHGAGKSIDTTTENKPIVGFIFGQKGLMAGVSLEGSKYSKIDP